MGDELILLLQKELTGELTSAESERMQLILRQWPEGAKLAGDMRAVWEQTATYSFPESPELDKDFGLILQRIRQKEAPAPIRVASRNIWWRAAAAAAILIVSTLSWQYWSDSSKTALLETTNTSEDRQRISLPDGSKVWLHRGTSIAYPNQFQGTQYREVSIHGTAYFEVFHDSEQPFRVHLPAGEIVEVLGTQFCVTSLEADNGSSVLVKSGSVRFSPNIRQPGPILTKGQKAVFDRQQSKVRVSTPASMNELAWQTGGLEFIQTPLQQVVSDLQSFYRVKIELRNPAMHNCRYTAPLPHQPLEQVLQSLVLIFKFDLQKTSATQYVLSGGKCE